MAYTLHPSQPSKERVRKKSTLNFGMDPNLFYGLHQSPKHFPRATHYVESGSLDLGSGGRYRVILIGVVF